METVFALRIRDLPQVERRRYFAMKQKSWRLKNPKKASDIQKRYYQNHRTKKRNAVQQYQLQRQMWDVE
jgi:hypothetical protein